jgi:ribonuclease BN (tRNA processing enzyme)
MLVLTHFSPSVLGDAVAEEARSIHPNIVPASDGSPIALN